MTIPANGQDSRSRIITSPPNRPFPTLARNPQRETFEVSLGAAAKYEFPGRR